MLRQGLLDDVFDPTKCQGCPLEGSRRMDAVSPSIHPSVMIVTDVPSASSAMHGRLISASSARLIQKHFSDNNFCRGDIVFVPQIRCPHDAPTYSTKDRTEIRKHCRQHLLDDIAQYRPEAIVPLGSEAARQVYGRAVKISKVRGVPSRNGELAPIIFPMLSPGFVTLYPQHEETFAADCRAFRRVFDGEEEAPRDYEYVTDLQFLIDAEPDILFFDIEATGLSPFERGSYNVRRYDPAIHGGKVRPHPAILSFQFCYEPGKAYMLVWDHPERPVPLRRKKVLREQLRKVLCREGTCVVGQNAKFDALYTSVVEGITYRIGGDTLMLATLLDENSISRSQDTLVSTYLPDRAGYADEFNSTYDKSRMWEVPLDDLFHYGCGDVETGFLLHQILHEKVFEDEGLAQNYTYVSIPGLNAFRAMEPVGMHVDLSALDAFERRMAEEVDRQKNELLDQVPRSILRENIDKGLSFTRNDFIRDILFFHRDGFRLKPQVYTDSTAKLAPNLRVPSVSSKGHLPFFFDVCPFTVLLAQHMKDLRMLGTSIRGFKEKYIIDGMVRPTYSLHTTVTGRSSSENPNGQNFPSRGDNAAAYRRCFRAPPGYVVIQADYSQIELRIVADMAKERTMLEIYRRGEDIHVLTGITAAGITMEEFKRLSPPQQKEIRRNAKAVNFGFVYGMWYKKFTSYAKTQYGVEYTEEQSKEIREAYFRLYPGLIAYHKRQIEEAMKYGAVRSYTGRLRHLPQINSEEEWVRQEAGRQAINAPVQNVASDLGIMSAGEIVESIEPSYLQPVAFVHDALYCYAPAEYAIWAAKTLKWFMEGIDLQTRFGLRLRVPLVADVSIGMNFGDTHGLSGLSFDEDFDVSSLWDDEKQKGIQLPEQLIPPGNGVRVTPLYDEVDIDS